MTPRTDVISQPSNELTELLAEIIYNDINKIHQLITFYEEANQFLSKLTPDSRKAEKLRQYIQPLETIKKIVSTDVAAYYEQQLGVQAKKEKVIDANNPSAWTWRYVLITSPRQVVEPALVLIKFVSNHHFFQIRIALVQIISQMDEFVIFLKDLASRVKSVIQTSAELLSRSAADKLILAMQLSSQLSLHGERLLKYKKTDEEVALLGEHIQALGALLTTAANASSTSAVISLNESNQKASQSNAAQIKMLRKIYTDEKSKLKAAAKNIVSIALRETFYRLIDWQIRKDIVEKEFAKHEKVDAWDGLSEQSLAVLARREAIQTEFSTLCEQHTFADWSTLASALKEFNLAKYQLAYAQDTVESYQDFVLTIFRSHSAKKAKWKECATKNNATLHAERQDKFKANLMTQLNSRMQSLDRLLIEIHAKREQQIPDHFVRIDFSNGADIGEITPRSRTSSLVLFGRKRASSASLVARGNASPRKREVKEMSSSSIGITDASSSMPSSPRSNVGDTVTNSTISTHTTHLVSVQEADSSQSITQSTLTNPGFVGSSRKYDQSIKGIEPVNRVNASSEMIESRAAPDFASRRAAIMRSFRLNLSSVNSESTNSSTSPSTVASYPGRK
jgi:hypothetical protein